jgi:hypothetical protein
VDTVRGWQDGAVADWQHVVWGECRGLKGGHAKTAMRTVVQEMVRAVAKAVKRGEVSTEDAAELRQRLVRARRALSARRGSGRTAGDVEAVWDLVAGRIPALRDATGRLWASKRLESVVREGVTKLQLAVEAGLAEWQEVSAAETATRQASERRWEVAAAANARMRQGYGVRGVEEMGGELTAYPPAERGTTKSEEVRMVREYVRGGAADVEGELLHGLEDGRRQRLRAAHAEGAARRRAAGQSPRARAGGAAVAARAVRQVAAQAAAGGDEMSDIDEDAIDALIADGLAQSEAAQREEWEAVEQAEREATERADGGATAEEEEMAWVATEEEGSGRRRQAGRAEAGATEGGGGAEGTEGGGRCVAARAGDDGGVEGGGDMRWAGDGGSGQRAGRHGQREASSGRDTAAAEDNGSGAGAAGASGTVARQAGGGGDGGRDGGGGWHAGGRPVLHGERHVQAGLAPTAPPGAARWARQRHGGACDVGCGARHAGNAGGSDGGSADRQSAGSGTAHHAGAPVQRGDDEAMTPRDGEKGGRRQRGDAREQQQRGDHESGSVGSAAQADDVAATHGDGGHSTAPNTPCSLHADANLPAGGGRRSASRELAGLSTSRCDTAAPATQVRRGGSRATAQDRHGDGPAAAAAAAAEAERARDETAARRRLERGSRVRIAQAEAGAAALRRGIAVGTCMTAMMERSGGGGRTTKGRRVRRGDG